MALADKINISNEIKKNYNKYKSVWKNPKVLWLDEQIQSEINNMGKDIEIKVL